MSFTLIFRASLFSLCVLVTTPVCAEDSSFGMAFQIKTQLHYFVGNPTWTVIVRDIQSGQVSPYVYNFTSNDNAWVGFAHSQTYQIISSTLQFGPPNAVIHDFCRLENKVLDNESFIVRVTGNLTPNRRTSHCEINHFKETSFPVVQHTYFESGSSNDEVSDPSFMTGNSQIVNIVK